MLATDPESPDQNGEAMKNQISGSLSLDVSGVAEAVQHQLRPALDDLRERLGIITAMMSAPAVLSAQQLSDALECAGAQNSQELSRHLTLAGYSLTITEPVPACSEPVAGDWFDREPVQS
jgi:hypothetical protein